MDPPNLITAGNRSIEQVTNDQDLLDQFSDDETLILRCVNEYSYRDHSDFSSDEEDLNDNARSLSISISNEAL